MQKIKPIYLFVITVLLAFGSACTIILPENEEPLISDEELLIDIDQDKEASENFLVFAASEFNDLIAFDAVTGREVWKFRLNNTDVSTNIFSTPAYADSLIFIASTDQNVYAVHAITGKKIWEFKTNSTLGHFPSSPLVANDVVYVAAYEKMFYALRAKTGELIWSREFETIFETSPTIENNTIFVTGNNGTLYAIDATQGNLKWTVGYVNYYGGIDYGRSSPAVKNGVVYALANWPDQKVTVINELSATDGSSHHGLYATFWLPENFADISSPTLDGEYLYAAGSDSSVYCIKTGDFMYFQKEWSYKTNQSIRSSPAYDQKHVYVASLDGTIYALHKKSGVLDWKFSIIPYGGAYIISSPVVANGILYCGSNNSIYALNTTNGELIWRSSFGVRFSSSPLVITKQGNAYHAAISGMQN